MPDGIIGKSAYAVRLRRNIPALSRGKGNLLLTGEPGTGKSFLALHLHALSPLCAARPVILNFACLGERDQRVGLFGGGPPELTTIRRSVLELPTTVILKHFDLANGYLQRELASAIRAGLVLRAGAGELRPVAARVILTMRDPRSDQGWKSRFEPGFSDAVGVVRRIGIPPLRDRGRDIPLLAAHFLSRFSGTSGLPPAAASRGLDARGRLRPALVRLLLRQPWPDNVRDLAAFMRSLVVHTFRHELMEEEKLEVLKALIMIEEGCEFSLGSLVESLKRNLTGRALDRFGNCRSGAAQLLGVSDRSIRRRAGASPLRGTPRQWPRGK